MTQTPQNGPLHLAYDDEELAGQAETPRDFSQNSVTLTVSWSLMNHLRSMARMEGISVEALLIELAAEGVAKRVFEDQNKPMPSHLMTRNGYVHDDDPQPYMSHHANLRQNNNGNNNGNNKKYAGRSNSYGGNNNRSFPARGSHNNGNRK